MWDPRDEARDSSQDARSDAREGRDDARPGRDAGLALERPGGGATGPLARRTSSRSDARLLRGEDRTRGSLRPRMDRRTEFRQARPARELRFREQGAIEARAVAPIDGRRFILSAAERQLLADLSAWRVINAADARQLFRDLKQWRQSLRHLSAAGLVREARRGGLREPYYLTPTTSGARLAKSWRTDREQGYLAGFRKDRAAELRHDAAVYRASLKEIEKAEKSRGRLVGTLLDDELRRRFNRDRARQERQLGRALEETDLRELAAHHNLGLDEQGRVQFPDAQLVFQREDASRYIVSVEVVTGAYNRSSIAAKHAAGFHLYAASPADAGHGRGAGFIETLDDIWS